MNDNGTRGGPAGGDEPSDGFLADLRTAYEHVDPVPSTLAERVLFAVRLEDLDAELAVLVEHEQVLTGARSEEPVRTVTFSSSSLTATITISESAGGGSRLDGWLAPAEALRVEVRRTDHPGQNVFADDGGRFVVEGLAAGLVQLVFHPVDGERGALTTPVAAPPVRL